MPWICAIGIAVAPPVLAEGTAPHEKAVAKIVIDPGHGGDERGAVGKLGLDEKALTLSLGLALRDVLEKAGFQVVMTRTDDRVVGLWDRPALANREGAQLFVSLHANSSPARRATGVETYFLSIDAPDEDARKLAAIENAVVAAPDAPTDAKDDVTSILWSMAQERILGESQRLAEGIQAELDRALAVPDRGIKQAPFVVLRNATMPAVLVEVGFLSNPAIEKKLSDPEYQATIVKAIAAGIKSFSDPRP
ncbi:MAG: N-acetylmuramoyl-L-alanine amidase [Acidobacteriota bacterium]